MCFKNSFEALRFEPQQTTFVAQRVPKRPQVRTPVIISGAKDVVEVKFWYEVTDTRNEFLSDRTLN